MRRVYLLLIALLACACDPVDSDPPEGPLSPEKACEAKGGDYLCQGTPQEPKCSCILP